MAGLKLNWLQGSFVSSLKLDIVGFLAVLGDGSVTSTLQVSTLSKLVFVPRLLPAPQVFLRPSRPSKLESSPGNVTGVFSGNDKDFVNYMGHVVLDAEDMPQYSVRCVEILRRPGNKNKVTTKTAGPLSCLVLLGFVESVVLLVLALLNRDGLAVLAVIVLSLLSTLVGLSNSWTLELPKRHAPPKRQGNKDGEDKKKPPPGNVVIRYHKGSFLVVECQEDVARELYFAPENVHYRIKSPLTYRLMSLVGTLMLMLGIVALANSGTAQQIPFAASYMLLNAAYWIVAAMPARTHWDLSSFEVRMRRLQDPQPRGDEVRDHEHGVKPDKQRVQMKRKAREHLTNLNDSFTYALWKAIVATESIEWVTRNNALPETPVWNQWLKDALEQAKRRRVDWESGTDRGLEYDIKVIEVPEWEPFEHYYKLLNEDQRKKDANPEDEGVIIPGTSAKTADDEVE